MKVAELVNALSKLDPDSDVVCYTEDESFTPQGHLFRILEIEEVSVTEAEKCRSSDGIAGFKLGKTELSEKHVTIHVSGDF